MKKKLIVFFIASIALIIFVWMANQFIHVDSIPDKSTHSTISTNQEFESPTFTYDTTNNITKTEESDADGSPISFAQFIGYSSKYGPLPKSLQGTDIDGELLLDVNGNLIISHGLRNLFEYFLSAKNEESLDVILGRIREYIHKQIPDEPAREAIAILESYISYKRKLEEIESPEGLQGEELGTLDAIKDALARRMLLRRQIMSADVVNAFFGDEERYDQFNLQLIDIKQNSVLTPEAKEAEIIELEKLLPESIQIMRQEERTRIIREQTIDEMRKSGKSEQDIFEYRKNEMGEEAAKRWQKLENERKIWNNKVDSFMEQRKEITSDPNLTPQEQKLAIERLKFESFDESDMKRIDVEERIRLQNNPDSQNKPAAEKQKETTQ
jgi:lipase chaperone LimK